MTADQKRKLRRRAANRCEYCRTPLKYELLPAQIDHILASQHGGPSTLDNLALACTHCNAHKGPNIAGVDPKTGQITRLFNPRLDRWPQHFQWMHARLVGRTAVGRATVQVLAVNDPEKLAARAALMEEGTFFTPGAS